MYYPSKRVMLQGPSATSPGSYLFWPTTWQDIITENFISMVEHDYDTAMWGGPAKDSQADLDACEPFLNLCEEYGINAMLGAQLELLGGTDHAEHNGWVTADYEAAYGDYFDSLETDTRVVGYFGESPEYIGAQWLRSQTSKILTYDYYVDLPADNQLNVIAFCDEVVIEAFWVESCAYAITALPAIHTANPALRVGVWHQTLPTWDGDVAAYWAAYAAPPTSPPTTYAEQKRLAQYWLPLINAQMVTTFGRKFDYSVTQWWDCDGTFEAMLDFNDYLNLSYILPPYHKRIQKMQTTGHRPAYAGASKCVRPAEPILEDYFINTGKEFLLIKAIGTGGSHVISVGATEYTLTLSTTHPSILGTFPTTKFGNGPSITYDSTAIDISILRT